MALVSKQAPSHRLSSDSGLRGNRCAAATTLQHEVANMSATYSCYEWIPVLQFQQAVSFGKSERENFSRQKHLAEDLSKASNYAGACTDVRLFRLVGGCLLSVMDLSVQQCCPFVRVFNSLAANT